VEFEKTIAVIFLPGWRGAARRRLSPNYRDSPFLSSATPPRPAESVENDPAATLAVSKRLQVLKNNATNFPLVGGLYDTREAVHAE
jgi:hypothetical protein